MAVVFGIAGLVRRCGGRLPDPQVFGARVPLYLEGGMEVCVARPMQQKFMDCAVAVTEEGLTVFTFGTPFIFVPRAAWAGKLATGQGWLGSPYVRLPLDGDVRFLKWSALYRGAAFTLKIYSQDLGRLRAAMRA